MSRWRAMSASLSSSRSVRRLGLAPDVLRIEPGTLAGLLLRFEFQGTMLKVGDLPAHPLLDRRLDLVELGEARLSYLAQMPGHQIGDRQRPRVLLQRFLEPRRIQQRSASLPLSSSRTPRQSR